MAKRVRIVLWLNEEGLDRYVDDLVTRLYGLERLPEDPRAVYTGTARQTARCELRHFERRGRCSRQRGAIVKMQAENMDRRISE